MTLSSRPADGQPPFRLGVFSRLVDQVTRR